MGFSLSFLVRLSISFFFVTALMRPASASTRSQYREFFRSTYQSVECLRSPDGLINDRGSVKLLITADCDSITTTSTTSPTNIAFDILSQIAAIELGFRAHHSMDNLNRIVNAILGLERHPTNGLFFSWYQTLKPYSAQNRNVSSVDNIHLALALWTLAEKFPKTEAGKSARSIFDSMDFNDFYHEYSGLMGGNLQFRPQSRDWFLEGWSYSYFGSEARSIGALGFALGKFQQIDFPKIHTSAYRVEFTSPNHILRTWDGGIFQLLLPELLMSESLGSPTLKKSFQNFAGEILTQDRVSGFTAPHTYSASQAGEEGVSCGPQLDCYNGKAGNLSIVALDNFDVNETQKLEQWEAVFTPHAAFLVATLDPVEFSPIFERLKRVQNFGVKLYDVHFGWMDGLRVKPPYIDTVVPVQLALDQEMILLSLSRILSRDGLSPSARALRQNRQTEVRLKSYLSILDERLSKSLNGIDPEQIVDVKNSHE